MEFNTKMDTGLSRDELVEKVIDLQHACIELASQAESVKGEIAGLQEERRASVEKLDKLKYQLDEMSRQRASKIAVDPDRMFGGNRPRVYKTPCMLRVSDQRSLGGTEVAILPKDSTVTVLEIVRMPEIHRVRARIQEPAGWISLLSMERGSALKAMADDFHLRRPALKVMADEVDNKSDDLRSDLGSQNAHQVGIKSAELPRDLGEQQKMREALLEELFHLHDVGNTGTIEKRELKRMNEKICCLHYGPEEAELRRRTLSRHFSGVFDEIDTDLDGHVDRKEFRDHYISYLSGIDSAVPAQLLIIEQFVEEARAGRTLMKKEDTESVFDS